MSASNNKMLDMKWYTVSSFSNQHSPKDTKTNCLESHPSNFYYIEETVVFHTKFIIDICSGMRKKIFFSSLYIKTCLPILRGDCQTKISIFDASTVIPDTCVQQHDIRYIDEEFKRFTFAIAFRRWSHGPRFATYYLSLPHES